MKKIPFSWKTVIAFYAIILNFADLNAQNLVVNGDFDNPTKGYLNELFGYWECCND